MENFPFPSSAGGEGGGTMKVLTSPPPTIGWKYCSMELLCFLERTPPWRFPHKTTQLPLDVQVAPLEHLRWPHISPDQGWKLFKVFPNGGFLQTELCPNLQPARTVIKNPSIKPHPHLSALQQILNISSLTQNKCCYIL